MILVGVCTFSESFAAYVTVVIVVCVYASREDFATVVTNVTVNSVSAYNVESIVDLFSDVSVTSFRNVSNTVIEDVFHHEIKDVGCFRNNRSIGDVNEDYVLHGVSIEERTDGIRSGEEFTEIDAAFNRYEYFNAGNLIVNVVYIFKSSVAESLNFNNIFSEVAEHSAKFSLIKRFDHSASFSIELVEVSIDQIESGKSNGVSFKDTEVYESVFNGFSSIADSVCYSNNGRSNRFNSVEANEFFPIDILDCVGIDLAEHSENVFKYRARRNFGHFGNGNSNFRAVDVISYVFNVSENAVDDIVESACTGGDSGVNRAESRVDLVAVNSAFESTEDCFEYFVGVGVCGILDFGSKDVAEVNYFFVKEDFKVETETGECTIVTEENDLCIGVDRVNSVNEFGVFNVELNVAIEVRFYSICNEVCNGDFNGIGCVFTEHSLEAFFSNHAEDSSVFGSDFIDVFEEVISNFDIITNSCGNTCCDERIGDSVNSIFNVSCVLFAYESIPIHFSGFSAFETEDKHIVGNRGIDSGTNHFGNHCHGFFSGFERQLTENVCNSFLNEFVNVSFESNIKVFSNVAVDLCNSKVGGHAFGVTDGDEVSLCDNGSVDIPAHGGVLVFAETHLFCEEFCVNCIFAADSNIIGISSYSVVCIVCGVREECLDKSVEVISGFCNLSSEFFCSLNCFAEEFSEVNFSNCNEVCDESVCDSDLLLNLSFNESDSFEDSVYFCIDDSESLSNFFSNYCVNYAELFGSVSVDFFSSDLDERCEFIEVGFNLCSECNDGCIEFCIKLISVCDNSAESFDGSNGAVSTSCELSCDVSAVVFGITVDPVFCVSYSVDSFNERSVHLSDVTFFYSKLISFFVESVVVFVDVVAKNAEIVNSLVNGGVLFSVRGTNCFKESVVTFCRGVCTDTVTDEATTEETKETLKNIVLAHTGAHVIGQEVEEFVVVCVVSVYRKNFVSCVVIEFGCNLLCTTTIVSANKSFGSKNCGIVIFVNHSLNLEDHCVSVHGSKIFIELDDSFFFSCFIVYIINDPAVEADLGGISIGVAGLKVCYNSSKEFRVNFVLVGLACKDCSVNIFLVIFHNFHDIFYNDGKILDCCEAVKAESRGLACFDDCFFDSQIKLNYISVFIFRSICDSVFFKCLDFIKGNVRKIHKIPNITVTKINAGNAGCNRIAYDSVMETSANDIVETVCIGIDDNFNLGGIRVVDGSISVCFIVYYLNGSVSGEVSVNDIESETQVFAEVVGFTVEFKLYTGKSVHQTNDHDFNIRVQSNDSVKNLGVVVAEIEDSIDEEVCDGFDLFIVEVFECFILRKHCEVLVTKRDCFFNKRRIASIHEILKLNIVNNFSVAGAAEAETSHELVHNVSAEFSVTETHGNDVCISDAFDVKVLKFCEEFVINNIAFSIDKISPRLADVIDKAGITVFDIFAAANEVKEVAGKHCGSSKLDVVYVVNRAEVICELIGVSSITVVAYFAVSKDIEVTGLSVAIQAVAVGHGVAKRNVVEIGLFCCLIVVSADSAYSGSENAEQHDQRHEYRKSFCTHFLEIHFDSFPRS